MRLKAVDAILATNTRYAGAAFQKPENGTFIPIPNNSMVRIQQDAKLNAAKAIVAEQLAEALEAAFGYCDSAQHQTEQYADERSTLSAALTAWRQLIE